LWLGSLALSSKYEPVEVALKLLRLGDGESERTHALREIQKGVSRWVSLSNPHVLPVYGTCRPALLGEAERVNGVTVPVLVCGYCPNQDIRAYLSGNPAADRVQLLRDMADGLAYLHSEGIIHGDVKPGNTLVDASGRALLSDFDLYGLNVDNGNTTTGIGGTTRYLAPELATLDGDDRDAIATKPGDIWALSMTALEVLSGKLPFYGIRRDLAVIIAVSGGRLPRLAEYPQIQSGLWSVLSECWVEAEGRPSASDIAHHFANSAFAS